MIIIIMTKKILGHYKTYLPESNYIGCNFYQILKVLFASVSNLFNSGVIDEKI